MAYAGLIVAITIIADSKYTRKVFRIRSSLPAPSRPTARHHDNRPVPTEAKGFSEGVRPRRRDLMNILCAENPFFPGFPTLTTQFVQIKLK